MISIGYKGKRPAPATLEIIDFPAKPPKPVTTILSGLGGPEGLHFVFDDNRTENVEINLDSDQCTAMLNQLLNADTQEKMSWFILQFGPPVQNGVFKGKFSVEETLNAASRIRELQLRALKRSPVVATETLRILSNVSIDHAGMNATLLEFLLGDKIGEIRPHIWVNSLYLLAVIKLFRNVDKNTLVLKCDNCESYFEATKKTDNRTRFCSDRCRVAAHRKRKKATNVTTV